MGSTERRRTPKPRSWIADPAASQSFGRDINIGWKLANGDPQHEVQITAARMQHRIAIHIRRSVARRRAAGESGLTFPAIAKELTTVDYNGLMRLMRGDVAMSLLHIADLTRQFDALFNLSTQVQQLRID